MNGPSGKSGNDRPNPSEPTLERSPLDTAETIPAALDSVLRTAGVDTRDPNVVRALEISLTMMFSDALPLPPPPILKEYDSVHPELVNKIIEWTEQQSAHRRALEKTRTERSESRFDRGQWIAATVAVGGLCLAAIEGTFGSPAVAIAIAVVAIGGPTAAIWIAQNIRPSSSAAPTVPPTTPPPGSPSL
jgi:uncharacterized membrane protein